MDKFNFLKDSLKYFTITSNSRPQISGTHQEQSNHAGFGPRYFHMPLITDEELS